MPTHSCVQWSTAMKTVALPSRVVRDDGLEAAMIDYPTGRRKGLIKRLFG